MVLELLLIINTFLQQKSSAQVLAHTTTAQIDISREVPPKKCQPHRIDIITPTQENLRNKAQG